MHGNVNEWCADHWHDTYVDAPEDGAAWLTEEESAKRVLRGGCWYADVRYCRSSSRFNSEPGDRINYSGFRVACGMPSSINRSLKGTNTEAKLPLSQFQQDLRNKPVEVFISYSRADEQLKDELCLHLASLTQQGKIKLRHDRIVGTGSNWNEETQSRLALAEVIFLLVTPQYISSDYCFDEEMQRAMERHERENTLVIPIIMQPCGWQTTPFSVLQALPKNGKPVSAWLDREEAWRYIISEVQKLIDLYSTAIPDDNISEPSTGLKIADENRDQKMHIDKRNYYLRTKDLSQVLR